MKLLTANFISCPVRTCKSSPASFPLHFKDCELACDPDGNPYSRETLLGVLPRLEWAALRTSAGELGFTGFPVEKPVGEEVGEEVLRRIWEVLVQTHVVTGKMVCGSCGYEFGIQSGIANFLLPGHLV
ncbi:adoMet-dependent tRNA methyltransferase complex subunit Trm112 [Tirmania nivea]|nr:adoMet-dependent tRNA methyltransferase complex subunit Trm112 [Tirmania nivea]